MILWEILVPRRWNNGKPIRTRHHKEWDRRVKAIAGGLTVLTPTIKGEWVSLDGDSTIPVRIACDREQINQIMDITAKHYKQLAVMAYKISDEVLIRNYK